MHEPIVVPYEQSTGITIAVSPAILPILIFVDIISQMKHIVNRVFAHRVSLLYIRRPASIKLKDSLT